MQQLKVQYSHYKEFLEINKKMTIQQKNSNYNEKVGVRNSNDQ